MTVSASRTERQQGAIRVVPETDHIVAVCLEGDFDLTNAPDLDDQITKALGSGYDLILDLSEATFIDSSIIRVVMRTTRAARRREQAMVMQLGTATIVERVLELVRIEQVLPRAHNRHEAVGMIHGATQAPEHSG